MDGTDWRVQLAMRYMRAFENGDLAELDAVLGPNFHEYMQERDEIDRLGQIDHLRRLIDTSTDRRAELSNFMPLERDLSATFKLDFKIGHQTWTVESQLRFRFEERLIDHVTVFNADIRCHEPMQSEHT